MEAPDELLTALKPIATLETSVEANYDGHRTDTGQTKRLIGARATALPKNQYDSFECLVCTSENETHDHIYECKEIINLKNFKHSEIPKYQEIFNGNVHKKILVARILKENLEIRDLKPS